MSHTIAVERSVAGWNAVCGGCGWRGETHAVYGSFVGSRHGGDPYQAACRDAFEHIQVERVEIPQPITQEEEN